MQPYVTCYMMTSVDGRIDCAMTEHLPGVEKYYPILDELGFDATVSGRVTAQLEMAEPGKFVPQDTTPVGKEAVLKKTDPAAGYDVVVDTRGTLLWKDGDAYEKPLIIVTSEQVSREYLAYLEAQGISYIAAGAVRVDLARVVEILGETFSVKRLGIVGGPSINTAFLDAGLLDEVMVLIGAGIDGRAAFPPVFNRTGEGASLTLLKLVEAKTYQSGAVLIRYQVK